MNLHTNVQWIFPNVHILDEPWVAIIDTFVKSAGLFTGFNVSISVKSTVLTING